MKVVLSSEMSDIEERAEGLGVSRDQLMENSGLAVADFIGSEIGNLDGIRVVALIGSGNNGSDGLITCSYLARRGAKVTAAILANRNSPDVKLRDAERCDVHTVAVDKVPDGLNYLLKAAARSHVLVDAVLGTGLSRVIVDPLKTVLEKVSEVMPSDALVVAVDLPSGLDSDGDTFYQPSIVPSMTVALGYPKLGHLTPAGIAGSGVLRVADIGIPGGLDSAIDVNITEDCQAAELLPKRPRDSNKGTFGKAMIVGGSSNFVGAPVMAAAGAARSGAGIVTLSGPRSSMFSSANLFPEITLLPFVEDGEGMYDGWLSARNIYKSITGYTSLLLGCGLGVSPESKKLTESLLLSFLELPPLVIDADGLNLLAGFSKWWDRLPDESVITPHPGEMSRLTGLSVREIQSNRVAITRSAAEDWKKVVVLKGANTVIGMPEGSVWISEFVNSGLSTAGTGDVLAGLITGLIAQGVTTRDAAVLGVYLHGVVGNTVSDRLGKAGMMATDLLTEIPTTISYLQSIQGE